MPFHSYLVFDALPSVNALSSARHAQAKKEFAACIKKNKKVRVEAYATLAFKAGTRFMLHVNASTPEDIQNFARDLLHTALGKHLTITYTLFGTTRSSQYNPHKAPAASAPEAPHTYLVVYPFTKTIEWHLLPYEERRTIMKAHVDVGRKYSKTISQLLLYAFGIDDHEFIVSYQMDSLEEFQSLVMEMRATESRRHTERDTPIFTGVHMPIAEALRVV
jgi:chlorite dismutase